MTLAPLLSFAIGIGAAALLFRVLAGRPLPRGHHAALLGTASVVLGAYAAGEEVVWRWPVLGGLSSRLGLSASLLVSTLGFACTHERAGSFRPFWVHALTGATFGSVYVLTGGLVGAIACHAAYNVLIALALTEARRGLQHG